MAGKALRIVPFEPQWQDAARALVLASMEEHWGRVDPTMNPDLDDIGRHYRAGHFLLAFRSGRLVGTGAVLPDGKDAMRVLRMSVAKEQRRRGVGSALLEQLLDHARWEGYRRLVCETTETWDDAVAFYVHHNFEITGRRRGEAHFLREIGPR